MAEDYCSIFPVRPAEVARSTCRLTLCKLTAAWPSGGPPNMIRTADTAPTSPSFSPKARALLFKFTSPFAPRARNLSDFHIRTDEPHRHFAPGDVVKGSVCLTVTKPLRVTHVVICLYGFVKVYKSPGSPRDAVPRDGGFQGPGRGTRGSEYFGNGFASLFEDEVILCGEGRLNPGTYEFRFELELPSKGMPSSIDFERGTISYMLTSTLTRPTTITPTTSCDRKIYLVETIDIAQLHQPKPRVISLKPISKRSRAVRPVKSAAAKPKSQGATSSFNIRAEGRARSPESAGLRTSDETPQSPVPSEVSSVSGTSVSTVSFRVAATPPLGENLTGCDVRSSIHSIADKTITATIEFLCGGCLPGDVLPVQITIEHTKPIKSLQGVIMTLYRQGRIESHPSIPLGPPQKGKKQEYEDLYPKSRTGLGGLSLSSAGSSGLFRKDLSQTFAPLIVDPQSLIAVIKTSVRVPEDVFPTISGVPGAMISFKYYVEVVIDLGGKLAAQQDRIFPRIGMTSVKPTYGYGDATTARIEAAEGILYATSGPSVLDTDQMRREKSVVDCLFEVIVGTRDSERKRVKKIEGYQAHNATTSSRSANTGCSEALVDQNYGDLYHEEDGYNADYNGDHQSHHYEHRTTYPEDLPRATTINLPVIDEDFDEKTRLRRAEQQLLPSAPPEDGERNASAHVSQQPSAPEASRLDNPYYSQHAYVGPSAPAYTGPPAAFADTILPSTIHEQYSEELHTDPSSQRTDDKQELERQRLQMAASAPDDYSGEENGCPVRQEHAHIAPSAPTLDGEDSYVARSNPEPAPGDQSSRPEHLPRYER